jgi:hypothetical protein
MKEKIARTKYSLKIRLDEDTFSNYFDDTDD